MPTFRTIRQVAALGFLSENHLRELVAKGKCPGIRTGNRFMVNVDALGEYLDAESRKCGAVDIEADNATENI